MVFIEMCCPARGFVRRCAGPALPDCRGKPAETRQERRRVLQKLACSVFPDESRCSSEFSRRFGTPGAFMNKQAARSLPACTRLSHPAGQPFQLVMGRGYVSNG